MKVKICGITNFQDAKIAIDLGATNLRVAKVNDNLEIEKKIKIEKSLKFLSGFH